MDERTLRELYLLPFELILAAHPWAVMAAYNAVNGPPMTESPLLRDVLKDEWGCDGLVMSDWGAARDTLGAGGGRAGPRDARPVRPWGDALVAAVRDGRVERVRHRRQGPAAAAPRRAGRRARWRGARRRAAASRRHPRRRPRHARRGRTAEIAGRARAPPPPRGSSSRATTGRCSRSPRGTLRARRGHRPERGRRPDARRRQRDRLPALHGLSARRAARGAPDAEITHAPGVRAHTRLPVAAVSAPSCASSPPTARARHREARDRRVHLARDARPGRHGDRGPHDDHRRARRRAPDRLLRRRPLPAHARRRARPSTSGSR